MEMIRYDQMDPAKPPVGVKLEICTNCRLPAKARRGRQAVTYIHTAWKSKSGSLKHRHYCKLSYDGRDVEVVIPVLPAEEKPCGST